MREMGDDALSDIDRHTKTDRGKRPRYVPRQGNFVPKKIDDAVKKGRGSQRPRAPPDAGASSSLPSQ